MKSFVIENDKFLKDGKEIKIHSGAIHYFRIPKAYWRDRLLKLKECGFNTVETYTAWNLHEKFEGQFDFTGELDLDAFISTAEELGLNVIVRPGPYICAEWEFGGFPYWLKKYEKLRLRCDNPLYLKKLLRYLGKLTKILARHVYPKGNLIMVQIENEYGSYGNDKTYLAKLKNFYRKRLPDCQLFTSNGPDELLSERGSLKDVTETFNFGSKVNASIPLLKKIRPDQPLMCGEFWCGWFDHWYEDHHVRSAEDIANETEPFLQNGYNFNFYMFCGGTNFGFMNGANGNDGTYMPTVTSYDYNALLTEAGDRTPAYYKIRELFDKYCGNLPELTAKESKKKAYGEVKFTAAASLFDNIDVISKKIRSATPLSFEECDLPYGYMLYVVDEFGLPQSSLNPEEINLTAFNGTLRLKNLQDRAVIFDNGQKIAVYERGRDYETVDLKKRSTHSLAILVENMGRVNFGPDIEYERKGIRSVTVNHQHVFGYTCYPLPLDNLDALKYQPISKPLDVPAFYKGEFFVDEPCDTFVLPKGFSHGIISVNGFNLGRYYNAAGPQKTLYLPASILKQGKNEIVIFDTDGASEISAETVDTPIL